VIRLRLIALKGARRRCDSRYLIIRNDFQTIPQLIESARYDEGDPEIRTVDCRSLRVVHISASVARGVIGKCSSYGRPPIPIT
jgi:hypothetical protein